MRYVPNKKGDEKGCMYARARKQQNLGNKFKILNPTPSSMNMGVLREH